MPKLLLPFAPTAPDAWDGSSAPCDRRRRSLLLAAAATLPLTLLPGVSRASLADLVAASRAAVLPVGTFNELASPRFGFRGTGFVVGDGNTVVTNAHVLPEPGTVPAPQLAVLSNPRPTGGSEGSQTDTAGGAAAPTGTLAQVRRASVLQLDRTRDLALLRIDGPPLPTLTLAGPDSVREGMDIALMGFPIGGVFGFSVVTHRGIVASITRIALPSPTSRQLDARAVAALREGPFEVYQLDATAYPGNSGGPVLDPRTGAVVGVINMVLVRGTRESALTNPTGISYAIPARFVQALMTLSR